MPRPQAGGRSMRVEVTLPNALYESLEKWMRRNKVGKHSDAVRRAVAELVGQPELAAGVTAGRPKAAD